jgi:hypothetical protein
MNQEHYISTSRLIAFALWGVVIGFIGSAWAVILIAQTPEGRAIGFMMGFTGVAFSAAAAVAHLRIYHMKMACLVRLTNGLSGPSGPSESTALHRVH